MAIIPFKKKYTETLAVMLDRFRVENPEYSKSKITYAGRLDPMAEGLVILLTDADVHKKEEFLNLDKVYEVDFIFGPDTDTYDILGLILDSSQSLGVSIHVDKISCACQSLVGPRSQPYPAYSSKPVNGKPLFMWAREGRISEIVIPEKKVNIYSLFLQGVFTVPAQDFLSEIKGGISRVTGDFRQKEIQKSWENYFEKHANMTSSMSVYTLKIHASSGAYVRSLVHALGNKIGIPATSLKIRRLQVGNYALMD
ncbi:MAG: hypothetical protein ACPGTS_01040 [Minisyncoccia bacterium]